MISGIDCLYMWVVVTITKHMIYGIDCLYMWVLVTITKHMISGIYCLYMWVLVHCIPSRYTFLYNRIWQNVQLLLN